MTAAPEPRDFQTEVFDRLDRLEQRLDSRIQGLEQKLDDDIQRLDERTDKWEERFLQSSNDNLAISRIVIIAAATVVTFGSLLDKAEILVEGTAKLFGK